MRWLLVALALAVAAPAAAQDDVAALIADRVRVEGGQRLVADGTVEVIYGERRLKASRITFDRGSGELLIEGPLTLIDGDTVLVLADAARLDSDLRNGILTSARVVLDEQLQLAAQQVRRVDGRYTELTRTVASACQVCASNPTPLWAIRAKRVIHDAQEQRLYFEEASFRVAGVPIFYLPRFALPDPTVKRATGFLVPDLRSTSQLGTGLKIPYFIALGPSRDLTVTPYLSPHTRTVELRYRQAFRTGRIAFEGAVSNDDIKPDTRGYLFGEGAFALPNDFNLTFGVELTSDPAYLLDYGYSGKDRLSSVLRVDRFRRNERFVARFINFRTLRDSEIPIEDTLPYLLGSVDYERRFAGVLGGEARLGFALQGHQRTSDVDVDGRDVLRAGVEADWRRNWIWGPGIETELEARLNVDAYVIGQDSTYPGRFSNVTPALGATFRWPLARAEAGGGMQVLEPVVQLAWSETSGTLPPNEDSTLVEFDRGNLFSLDRFPGSDRHESGPRAAVGLHWTRYSPGGWTMGATLARVFRAEPSDFTAASGLDGTVSDWLLVAEVNLPSHFTLTSRSLIDDDAGFTKAETRLNWSGERFRVAATHLWAIAEPAEGRLDPTNELTVDTSYAFTRHWTVSGDMRYDIAVDRAASAGVGVVYRNECVTVDLSLSRRFTSSTSVAPTTDVGLKVSLNGFGSDGRDFRRTCSR